jgi:hypothetical protein
VILYGCNNTPREDGYMVRDSTLVKGSIEIQVMRYHKNTSTRDCQYRRETPADPRCTGCAK